jgi:hypothetical protein
MEKLNKLPKEFVKGKIKYTINENKTTVKLPDGREGSARRHPDDENNEYYGLAVSLLRAYHGKEGPISDLKQIHDFSTDELLEELRKRVK